MFILGLVGKSAYEFISDIENCSFSVLGIFEVVAALGSPVRLWECIPDSSHYGGYVLCS